MLNKFLLERMKENNLYFRGGNLSKNIRFQLQNNKYYN